MKIHQEGGLILGWEEAVTLRRIVNALYQYSGKDRGNSSFPERVAAGADPILVSGIAYLVYVNATAGVTALEVSKPR